MSVLTEDELNGPGGKGYSWFRFEVVSEHVPLPRTYYDVRLTKPRKADTSVYNPLVGVAQILKTDQALTWIDKFKQAISWIRKEN